MKVIAVFRCETGRNQTDEPEINSTLRNEVVSYIFFVSSFVAGPKLKKIQELQVTAATLMASSNTFN